MSRSRSNQNMQNDLTITDFERVVVDAELYYLRHEYIGFDAEVYELCLEPCFNGFDVANYLKNDLGYNLTLPKYCTRVDMRPGNGLDLLEAITRAIAMASYFKNKYAYKMQKTIIKDNMRGNRP